MRRDGRTREWTNPDRSLMGHLANMGAYLVGHSKVSRRIFRGSCKPMVVFFHQIGVPNGEENLTSYVYPLHIRFM